MSVCAVKIENDKIVIGVDSQVTQGANIVNSFLDTSKIFIKNNVIVGGCGSIREINALKIFMNKNLIGDATEENILQFMFCFQQFKQELGMLFDLECSYIFIIDNKVYSVVQGEVIPIENYYAIGSGRDFALSALYLGHSVEESLKVACALNIYCNEPIEVKIIDKMSV